MKTGTVVKLINSQGKNIIAKNGSLATISHKEEFPEYYNQLCDKIGKQDADNEFVFVKWIRSEQENGAYAKCRFIEIKGATKI